MNILFCGNSRAFDGILIAVLSITKYYKGELNIYIFTAELENMREDYTPICWQQARIIEYTRRIPCCGYMRTTFL